MEKANILYTRIRKFKRISMLTKMFNCLKGKYV